MTFSRLYTQVINIGCNAFLAHIRTRIRKSTVLQMSSVSRCWRRKTAEQIQHDKEEEEARDVDFLRKMGYTQSLYRGLSPLMSISLGYNVISVLVSITVFFDNAMKTGGSTTIIWSWILGSVFTILTSLSLAEICSVYPSAGSVYHWSVKTERYPLRLSHPQV